MTTNITASRRDKHLVKNYIFVQYTLPLQVPILRITRYELRKHRGAICLPVLVVSGAEAFLFD